MLNLHFSISVYLSVEIVWTETPYFLEGIIKEIDALSKSNLNKAQAAFNIWTAESGKSLNEISRILAIQV